MSSKNRDAFAKRVAIIGREQDCLFANVNQSYKFNSDQTRLFWTILSEAIRQYNLPISTETFILIAEKVEAMAPKKAAKL